MKCLFVHDFRAYIYKDKVYSTNLTYEILKTRYLSHFDEVRIINRTKRVDKSPADKYVVSNGQGIIFANRIDMFSNLDFFIKRKKYENILKEEVEKADFLIVRLDSFLGLIALKYCEKFKKKYIIEVAGCVWDSFWNKGITGKLFAPVIFFMTRQYIKRADFVVYVTSSFLQNRYPTNGKNISCSNVMLDMIDYDVVLEKKLEFINQHTYNRNINIATIAAIDVPYKNQEAVIEALGLLKKEGKINYTYHLIGGGNQDRLKNICRKYDVEKMVIFHGSVNHSKVMELLDDMDIYIQPSKQEGLPRSLIEAMSRGCTCYGSRVAGIPELLDDDCIFKIKNASKQIKNLLNAYDDTFAKKMAEKNIKKSKKYLSSVLEKRRYEFIEEVKNS